MRINYVLYGTPVNGGVRVILELANGLTRRGHHVTVTTLGRASDLRWFPIQAKVLFAGPAATWRETLKEAVLDSVPALGTPLRRYARGRRPIEVPSWGDPVQVGRDTLRLIATMPECDVNIATHFLTVLPVWESAKGLPAYHMQHHEVLFSDVEYWKQKAAATYYLPMSKIANSTWLKREIESTYHCTDIPIVNPAIDHSIFRDRQLRSQGRSIRVISLGRPDRWKGFPELLEAMKLVMAEHRNTIEWVVFGVEKPPYADEAAPYTFVQSPINDELAELFSTAHIAVSPSWYESFPLPPLEAMACGCAVVTTSIGTEDYATDGETAIVVRPRDVQALASAIDRLIVDPRTRMRLVNNGLERARGFTWESSVTRTEQILESM